MTPISVASDALQRARGSNTRGFNVAQTVDVFNRLVPKSYPLFQGFSFSGLRQPGKRGSIQIRQAGQIGQEGSTIINLFRGADLSTLIHESGHFFLNIMQDMAVRGEAGSVGEMAAVKAW